MSRKSIPILLIFTGILLVTFALVFITAQPVSAQCKDPSTCRTCHEVQGQKSVRSTGVWHSQHAAFDFCAVCHGGDRKAADAAAAHQGMTLKLNEMGAACKNCHAADFDQRYAVYSAQLGGGQPAPSVQSNSSNALGQVLGIKPAVVEPAAAAQLAAGTSVPCDPNQGNIILSGLLVALVLGGGGYVVWNERRLSARARLDIGRWLLGLVRREHWSPYAAGILLGLTAILAVTVGNHLLGASGAVATLASTLLSKIAPAWMEKSMYYQYIMPPGLSWEVMLLVGIFFGGMLAALSSKTFRLRWNDDPKWNKIFGRQPWKRFVIGFIGAVILQYGAGIAGGCTSGLAISGGMLLAPSAFLFMAGMFATGILVALIVYRRRY